MLSAIADVRWIDLRSHNYKRSFEELVVRLSGAEELPKSRSTRFRVFVESLIVLGENILSEVDAISTISSVARRVSDQSMRDRLAGWRKDLKELLAVSGLSAIEGSRILADFDAGVTVPVISAEDKEELREWARRFGEDTLDFAGELWQQRQSGMEGTTVKGICDYIDERRHTRDSEVLWWKGEDLARRAMEAGLLVRSMEDPVAHIAFEAKSNPSYGFGWGVRVVGLWARAFGEREELARAGQGR